MMAARMFGRRRKPAAAPESHPYPAAVRPSGALQALPVEETPAAATFTPAADCETGPRPAAPRRPQSTRTQELPVYRAAVAVLGPPNFAVTPAPATGPILPGTSLELYSAPGWTLALAEVRASRGEDPREELLAALEDAHGRNAAAAARSMRRNRQRIIEGARRMCAEAGHPEMAGQLLRRVSEISQTGGAR